MAEIRARRYPLGPVGAGSVAGDFHSLFVALEQAEVERDDARAVANDGWAWVDEALKALGAETVFDIANAKACAEQLAADLAEMREALEGLRAAIKAQVEAGHPVSIKVSAASGRARSVLARTERNAER
jgi:hypothetical protein